jgi:Zn-dependent peptidase ImmA (M78 family)
MSATITALRDLVPIRSLTFAESLRIAELQATRLRELASVDTPAFPETAISNLPRLQIERMTPAPMSGATQWSHGRWLIIVNGAEPAARQRFSLVHEFKHILDNPFIHTLYPPVGSMSSAERAEQICDYFAGCVLVPRTRLKQAWISGVQDIRRLAHLFAVSNQAMQVRLLQVGLIERSPRCLPVSSPKEEISHDTEVITTH